MNIKLTINGKEIDAQISEEDAQKIQPSESRFVAKGDHADYWFIDNDGAIVADDDCDTVDIERFSVGNYFVSKKQAQDHLRALKLWQTIKVFRQEHEGDEWKKIDFSTSCNKFEIEYDFGIGKPSWRCTNYPSKANGCYFAKRETAEAAISEFYGELMWYFTEFEDD